MSEQAIGPATLGKAPASGGSAHQTSNSLIKPGYDPALTNADIAPLKQQRWGTYNIFAFWMSDVHSVGGYVTAGSLFALGLASWQVLLCLVLGILIVYAFVNLVARPSQSTSVPYAVVCRSVFGVKGANIPAAIRGTIAVAWFGIQTYLASSALDVVLIKLFPSLARYEVLHNYGFLGLPLLGWCSFAALWLVQVLVFWNGMETIRKLIDFCGPAVYVTMIGLCVYMLVKAGGFSKVDLNISTIHKSGWSAVGVMCGAVALVVTYFSGPMLNFGDFARYTKSYDCVKRGNFLGLPVNFVGFSLLTVMTASLTVPVYGKLITDPVATVARTNDTLIIVLGALTFVTATAGINVVANFIAPAFDYSNIWPQKVSWRMGGMIAAAGSLVITPWNLYNNPSIIHLTLDTLGAFIGPLFGVLIVDYYLIRLQRIVVDDLFTMSPNASYFYRKGYNPAAVYATIGSAVVAVFTVLFNGTIKSLSIPGMATVSDYSWFIGCGLGGLVYLLLATRTSLAVRNVPAASGPAPDHATAVVVV